jgi:hypothetical protein
MGAFYQQQEVVNRTARVLNVRFDGQDMNLEPNYTETGERIEGVHNFIPDVAIDFAINQNPVMGSEDRERPTSFLSLVGIVPKRGEKGSKWYHDCSFFDERAWAESKGTDALTRVPLSEYLEDDPTVKNVVVRGRRMDRPEESNTAPFDVRARG